HSSVARSAASLMRLASISCRVSGMPYLGHSHTNATGPGGGRGQAQNVCSATGPPELPPEYINIGPLWDLFCGPIIGGPRIVAFDPSENWIPKRRISSSISPPVAPGRPRNPARPCIGSQTAPSIRQWATTWNSNPFGNAVMCWTLMAAFGDRARRTLIGTASPRTCSGRIHLGRSNGSGGGGGGGGGGGSKNARRPSYRWQPHC